MDDEIQQIKDKIDIVSLISQTVPLKKSGRNYKGLCPFHSEKTPSFMVNADLQIFKCFGCGEAGDAFKFLMRQEGLDFREALEELAKRTGVKLSRRKEEKTPEEARRERIFAANELAAKFYNYLLTSHPAGRKALEYLLKRGLKLETIKKFNLGYAPNQNNILVKFLQKKGFSASEILEAGLALVSDRGGSYYDRFRGRVVFPLYDTSSRLVGFSARTLSSDPNIPKYLNSPETPVFHKSHFLYGLNFAKSFIRKSGRAVLVEGQMDLISNVQAGVENVAATSGSAFTTEMARALKKLAKEIVFCFDSDSAGQKALERAVEVLEVEGGLTPLVAVLPVGAKDPDEAAQSNFEDWQKNLKTPKSFYDYYLEIQTRDLLKSDALGKRRAAENLLPILARISDPLQKAHFSKQLSEKLDLEERFVSEALNKLKVQPFDPAQGRSGKFKVKVENSPPFSWERGLTGGERLETLRRYFLALLLRFDLSSTKKFLSGAAREFKGSQLEIFFNCLEDQLTPAKKMLRMEVLRQALPPEHQPLLTDLLLFDLGELEADLNLQEKEIGVAFKELQRESYKAQAAEVLTKIKPAEAKGEKEELKELQKKLIHIYLKLGKT